MTEVVCPDGGQPVALRPCPPWCILERHFGPGEAAHADDGYFHYGPETEIATWRPFPDQAREEQAVVRVYLSSWTCPLDAGPGPAVVEANIGTPAQRTDMAAELTPAEARAVARALLESADAAQRAGAPDAAGGHGSRRAGRGSGGGLLAGIIWARTGRRLEQAWSFPLRRHLAWWSRLRHSGGNGP